MTTPWKKVLRDVWRERTRTLLVVAAIAMGIAGFTTVLASYAVLTRALNEGYAATNPASATLQVSGGIDAALVRAVLANRDLSDAETRRTVSGRLKAGAAEWRNLRLFVVEDYGRIRVSTLSPEAGAWPPGKGELLIERDAFRVARAKIGDSVSVKIADGPEHTLRVTGSVHDVGQAQARMENIVYGYITVETLAALGEERYLDQLKVLVAERRSDETHIRKVVDEVRRTIESRGRRVTHVDIPPPGKHPHADIMGLLMLVMAGFGFFVLVLSGILVVNLLTASMAAETRQIGVMKAIGATRSQIARIYLGQAAMLGAAAIVMGLPFGLVGSRMLCRYQAVFLNFDIAYFAPPLWVYALVAAVGVLVPLLAAAFPVWKGSGVSVHTSLAETGVSANTFGASALDRLLSGWSGAARPLLLAMRNSFRRRTRLVLTVLTLATAGVFFLAAFNVRASLIHTLDQWFGRIGSDLTVTLATPQTQEDLDRALAGVPGVRMAEGWMGTSGDRFTVLAMPVATKLMTMEIVEGRALPPGDRKAMVVNTALAAKGIKVGQIVDGRRVVGISREAFSPPVGYVAKTDTRSNLVRLAVTRPVDEVKAALDRSFARAGIRIVRSTSKTESRYGFDQHMVMIYVFLIIMSAIIGFVGGLGLMTTMSLNVLERRREMGVLRAIGATPAAVRGIVVAEGLVIGGLSWVVAVVVAVPVSRWIGDLLVRAMFRTPLDFTADWRGVVIWLGVSIVVSAGASFLPAWHASRGSVREALAYE
jgi:putative ABC transport system permease protein